MVAWFMDSSTKTNWLLSLKCVIQLHCNTNLLRDLSSKDLCFTQLNNFFLSHLIAIDAFWQALMCGSSQVYWSLNDYCCLPSTTGRLFRYEAYMYVLISKFEFVEQSMKITFIARYYNIFKECQSILYIKPFVIARLYTCKSCLQIWKTLVCPQNSEWISTTSIKTYKIRWK